MGGPQEAFLLSRHFIFFGSLERLLFRPYP